MRPSLAIDFDGTVTKDDTFPNIGPEQMWVVDRISKYGPLREEEVREAMASDGVHVVDGDLVKAPATYVIKKLASKYEIIFHTCRTGDSQEMMIKWLSGQAYIPLYKHHDYYVNNNPYCPEAYQKPFADVYLDNRGLTWHGELNVEEEIEILMSKLPKHIYIPQK